MRGFRRSLKDTYISGENPDPKLIVSSKAKEFKMNSIIPVLNDSYLSISDGDLVQCKFVKSHNTELETSDENLIEGPKVLEKYITKMTTNSHRLEKRSSQDFSASHIFWTNLNTDRYH
jgi:hypothetical protein